MVYIKKSFLVLIFIMLFSNTIVHGQFLSCSNIKYLSAGYENALEDLRVCKSYHILKNFKAAIKGYDSILISSAPMEIKNEALIYKKLAENKSPISIKYVYRQNFAEIVDKSKKDYKLKHYSVKFDKHYSPFGSYFDYEKNSYKISDDLTFDKCGIPMVKYSGKFYYNPITIEQYALCMYGKYLKGLDTKNNFINCADFLVKYMDEKGAFKYDFIYNHYEDLKPGWTSAMAQGEALSVFARAFNITGDMKYIDAGNKALEYLITPVSKGGVMDTLETLDINLKDKIFFQEYVNSVSSYTLNGYIYTLIGLYDWSNVENNSNKHYLTLSDNYFNQGIESLKCILPYYDLGGYTSYDLYYITKKADPNSSGYYHYVHLEQLDALFNITNDNYFKDMRDLWDSYVR